MKKWITLSIMVLLVLPLVYSLQDCKDIMNKGDLPCSIISTYPFDCPTHVIKIFNETPEIVRNATLAQYGLSSRCNITFGIDGNETHPGSYLLNWSTGDSSKITITSEDEMASLSVTLFVCAITFGLIFIGIKFNFSKSQVANFIIKRVVIIMGMFLLSLDSSIIITIADNSGLGVGQELFRYLWIINWSIYLFIVYLLWNTVTSVLKLWEDIARNKRMGNDNHDEESQ